MEINNNENNNENGQPPKLDPMGDLKLKLVFFVVAIIILVGVKYGLGL